MEVTLQDVCRTITLKEKKRQKNNEPLLPQSCTSAHCILCRKSYQKNQAQTHLHSVLHHKELESVLGINTRHECYACEESFIGLSGYTKHITNSEHSVKLQSLISSNVRPTPLCQILSIDLIKQILKRNRRTKLRKKQNKRRQAANAAWMNHTVGSNRMMMLGTVQQVNQVNMMTPAQRNHQAGSQSAVVPVRKSNVSTLQDQSGTLPQSSQMWHNPFHQDEFREPEWPSYHNTWYGLDDRVDFTSDEIGERGAIIFKHGQNRDEVEALDQCPAQSRSSSACDATMTSMLQQIRRILGIREPCRADREAQNQCIEAMAEVGQTSGGSSSRRAATQTRFAPAVPSRPPHVSPTPAPAARPAKAKQTDKAPSNSIVPQVAQNSQTSPSQGQGRAAALPQPRPNIKSKVRVAHKPASNQGVKDAVLRATLYKLSTLYGRKKELNLRNMYTTMKRKKLQKRAQEIRATMPRFKEVAHPCADRFRVTLPKPPSAQGNATNVVDLTLSEGFHWDSVPGRPPDGHPDEPRSPSREDTKVTSDLQTETKSDSETKATSEVEDDIIEVIEVSAGNGNGKKKRCKASKKKRLKAMTTADISETEPVAKKKPKSNTDPDQLQQLLDVSLKEEEVSALLQGVDQSLDQARTVLQAAYLKVQRLIILKQQYTTEISSLRTQRIEILQGIQGGCSEDNNTAKEASTSSISIATQHPPAVNIASSISQPLPAPVTNPDKQESDPTPLASCKADTSQDPERDLERNGGQQVHTVTVCVPERPGNSSTGSKDEADQCVITAKKSQPPVVVIIDLDELESAADVPSEHQTSASSSATQTRQQICDDIKPELTPVDMQEDSGASSPAHVQKIKEEELSLGAFASHSTSIHHLLVHHDLLISCSGDNTAQAYSLTSKEREAEFTGHTSKVNQAAVWCDPNMSTRLFTGSSDQTVRCYDLKTKQFLEQISLDSQVLCLHIAWNTLFIGLSKGSVASYDLKTLKQLDMLECHGLQAVSCLDTGQEGARRLLLVGSYDSTISVRDAKNGLLLRSLHGHTKTVLCVQVVSDLVFSGSSNSSVFAHNIHTGKLIRTYKGHGHSVTSLAIAGNLMVTACLDKLVRVFDLQSPNCLQVYRGQSDMVTCVAVLKNVVYTGCSDGSIEAFKLDLSKNYRCWWQNCTLVFGMAEQLMQHVMGVHNKPSMAVIKCCWRSCNQQLLGEELQEHVKSHVTDSELQP